LKATAWNLYRNAPIEKSLEGAIESVWKELPTPSLLSQFSFAPEHLNFFNLNEGFYQSRKNAFYNYITFIHQSVEGTGVEPQSVRTRYVEGLPEVDKAMLAKTLAIVRAHTSSEMSPDLFIPEK
jgi:hypothetical protein